QVRVDLVPVDTEFGPGVSVELVGVIEAVDLQHVFARRSRAEPALQVEADYVGRRDRQADAAAERVERVRARRRGRVGVFRAAEGYVRLAKKQQPAKELIADLQPQLRRDGRDVLHRADVPDHADRGLDQQAVTVRRRWRRL